MFAFLIAWAQYVLSSSIVVNAALIYLILLALPNSIAGGWLFEKAQAWILGIIAAVLVFFAYVAPFISGQLLIGLAILAGIVIATYLARRFFSGGFSFQRPTWLRWPTRQINSEESES